MPNPATDPPSAAPTVHGLPPLIEGTRVSGVLWIVVEVGITEPLLMSVELVLPTCAVDPAEELDSDVLRD
jgi:hypothetical protein